MWFVRRGCNPSRRGERWHPGENRQHIRILLPDVDRMTADFTPVRHAETPQVVQQACPLDVGHVYLCHAEDGREVHREARYPLSVLAGTRLAQFENVDECPQHFGRVEVALHKRCLGILRRRRLPPRLRRLHPMHRLLQPEVLHPSFVHLPTRFGAPDRLGNPRSRERRRHVISDARMEARDGSVDVILGPDDDHGHARVVDSELLGEHQLAKRADQNRWRTVGAFPPWRHRP